MRKRIALSVMSMLVAAVVLACPRTVRGEPAAGPIDPELRARCVGVLRDVLEREERWIKVHAAEFLLRLGYPEKVQETYEKELAAHEKEPQYRIGCWRVLSKAVAEERRSAAWADKIRDVLLDPAAPDRLHAMESLAKLRYRMPKEYQGPVLEAAAEPTGAMSVFARWILYNSGVPGAENRLTELLPSPDERTRQVCGYVLGRLGNLSDEGRTRLAAAADRESAESSARVMLVAAAAIHTQGPARARFTEQLRAYLAKGKPDQRLRACDALGTVAEPGDLPTLSGLLTDPDPDLRAVAAWSVLRLDRPRPAVPGRGSTGP